MKMITDSLILTYQWPYHVWRTVVQQQYQAIAKVLESSSSFLISFSSTLESWARCVYVWTPWHKVPASPREHNFGVEA